MIKVKLSKLLGDKRMTQSELSRITGIRYATINDLYHDIVDRVSLEAIDKICIALNCDLSELLEFRK